MTLGLEMLLEANNCIFPVAETLCDLNTLKQKSRLVMHTPKETVLGIGIFILIYSVCTYKSIGSVVAGFDSV